jgi:hypothetical protein
MARGRRKARQANMEVKFPGTRRARRESVAAEVRKFLDGGDGPDDDGSAGVREPRRPKPLGPMSSAGERPMPQQEFAVSLPDPRY